MRVWLIVLAACGGGGEGKVGDTADPGAAPAGPTWYADVQSLAAEHCARCHDGAGVGPGDFTDYDVVVATADRMLARVEAGEMPPAAADPDCHPYLGADHMVMDEDETALLAEWIGAGTPLGDPATATAPSTGATTLADPDVVTTTEAPYTPAYADFDNEYRCFVLDWSPDADVFLTGIEPVIDTVAISHHSVLFVDRRGTSAGYITDPVTKSWDCPEVVPDGSWDTAYAWAPGNNPITFDEGHGMRVLAGSTLVLQMHYYRSSPEADGAVDQPGYRFTTADAVDDEVYMIGLGPEGFTIPAGDDAHAVSEVYPLSWIAPGKGRVHGVFPHMHVLGSSYRFWVEKAGGGESCIASADRYDFDNQPTYWFEEPVKVPADASIGVECVYNNSRSNPDLIHDPPVDVQYGERTDQEMCFALLYMSF